MASELPADLQALWDAVSTLPKGPSALAGSRPERVYIGTDWPFPLPEGTITLTAYGDEDDHLRLVALAAEASRDRVDADLVATCQSPTASWADRFAAFKALLRELGRKRTLVFVVDPDALEPDPDAPSWREDEYRWNDTRFTQQRRETLKALIEAAHEAPGWSFLRPQPQGETTRWLEPLGAELPPSAEEALEHSGAPVPPSDREECIVLLTEASPPVRKLVLGSVRSGYATWGAIRNACRGVSGEALDRQLVGALHRELPPAARSAAHRLSILRGTQPLNGVAGPFKIAPTPRPFPTVRPDAVERLARAGWLDRDERSFRIHRILRSSLAESDAEHARDDHAWVAEHVSPTGPLVEKIEAHFHAIRGRLVDRAFETAVCYGADLRSLATDLSRSGDFAASVRVWRRIVEEFDRSDAYAWEYLGYNLAKLGAPKAEALDAYERACRLDPLNPLYRGRLLGYLAEHGEAVVTEVDQWLERLLSTRSRSAVSFFAEPVLSGLSRGATAASGAGEARQRDAVLARWGEVLRTNDRLRERFGSEPWFARSPD